MMDTKREHPDCAFVRQSLPLHTGGDLGRTAAAKVEAHVRVCRPCAELQTRASLARNALVAGLGAGSGDSLPDIFGGVRARLAAPQAGREPTLRAPVELVPVRRPRLLPWIGGASAAAAALAIYLAVGQQTQTAPTGERVAELPAQIRPDASRGAAAVADEGATTAPRRSTPSAAAEAVLLAGRAADGDALRPLQADEVPLRHSALRTVEVPWMENNPGRVLTPGGSVSAVGWTVPVR